MQDRDRGLGLRVCSSGQLAAGAIGPRRRVVGSRLCASVGPSRASARMLRRYQGVRALPADGRRYRSWCAAKGEPAPGVRHAASGAIRVFGLVGRRRSRADFRSIRFDRAQAEDCDGLFQLRRQ